MIRLAISLAASALAVLPASLAAQSEDDACTVDTARKATIAQVRGNFERWEGDCVTLEGLLIGDRLYIDRFGLVTRVSVYDDSHPSIPLQRSELPHADRPARARVTGRVFNCGAIYAALEAQADEDSIVFVGGLCHYTYETALAPVAVSYIDFAPVMRLTEAEVSAASDRLVEAEPTLPGYAEHIATAGRMAEAIAECDEGTFYRLRRPELRAAKLTLPANSDACHLATLPTVTDWPDDLAAQAEVLRDGPPPDEATQRSRRTEAVTRSWRHEGTIEEVREEWNRARLLADSADRVVPLDPARRKVFRIAEEPEEVGTLLSGPSYSGRVFSCWCKGSDCTGKWPVIEMDADGAEERPYFCVVTSEYQVFGEAGREWVAEVRSDSYRFAEPDWATD